MSVLDIIKDARELLSDPGRWHKGDWANDDDTAFCVVAALAEVANRSGSLDDYYQADTLVENHVPGGREAFERTESGLRPLAAFNDAPETTHQDVLDVLTRTLADLGGL